MRACACVRVRVCRVSAWHGGARASRPQDEARAHRRGAHLTSPVPVSRALSVSFALLTVMIAVMGRYTIMTMGTDAREGGRYEYYS